MGNFVKKHRFAITKFTDDDDSLGVIPLCWVRDNGNLCMYPDAPTEAKRNKLLREEAQPMHSWTSHAISIMKTYGTYSEARENLRKAEETSNLESDEEILLKRKRKSKEIVLPGEISSEDEAPRNKNSRFCSRNQSHAYPSLDSFQNLDTFSPISSLTTSSQPLQVLTHDQFQQDNILSPVSSPLARPSKLANPSLSSPHGSGCARLNSPGIKGMSGTSSLDIDRLWYVLGQLQATAASQSEEISQLNKKIDVLLAQGSATIRPVESNEDSIHLNSLPLSSMEDFDQFESRLDSQEFRNLVVKLLATIGGKEPKLLIFNCMKRCFTSDLGTKFSYTGKASKDENKQKKRGFASTSLCSAIRSAVRKIYPETTEDLLKLHMGHWLQQAKNRLKTTRVVADHGI